MIVGLELSQASLPFKRFGLAELQDERGRTSGLELAFPGTEIQVAPLFVDGVRFPGHGAEDRVLGGEGRGEARLNLARLSFADEVLLSDKDHDFVLAEAELTVFERRRRNPGGLYFAEAVHHRLLGRDG